MEKKIKKVVVDSDNGRTYLVYDDGSHSLIEKNTKDALMRKIADKIPDSVQAGISGFQKGSELTEAFDDLEGIEKDYPIVSKIARGLGLGSAVAGAAGLAKTAGKKALKYQTKRLVKDLIEEAPIDKIMKKQVSNVKQIPKAKVEIPKVKAEVPDVKVPEVDKGMMKDILEEMRNDAVKDVRPSMRINTDKTVEELGARARREFMEKEKMDIIKREAEAALRRKKK